MTKVRQSGLSVCLYIVALYLLTIHGNAAESIPKTLKLDRYEFADRIMAVPVKIILYAPNAKTANQAAQAAFDRMRILDAVLSDYKPDSELNRLNATAGSGRAVPVSPDLFRVLQKAQTIARASSGAFDPTIGPVVKVWRRIQVTRRLAPGRIQEALARVGHAWLRLDPARRTAQLVKPGMRLDLGGIAKGYVIDQALLALKKAGLSRSLVDAGGDVALGDPPPSKKGWRIAVLAGPVLRKTGQPATQPPLKHLCLANAGIATSGDIFQYVIIKGKRYSHIVDPRTGMGLAEHNMATVVAPDGITADALASALCVLPPDKGMALAEQQKGRAARILRMVNQKTIVKTTQTWNALPVFDDE